MKFTIGKLAATGVAVATAAAIAMPAQAQEVLKMSTALGQKHDQSKALFATFVGPRNGLPGYYDACGGSGHGFKIGAAIGRHLAYWISENKVDDDFAGLSYDRLAVDERFVGAYGGNRA